MNQNYKYLGQRSFSSKVIVWTHTHAGTIALRGPLKSSVISVFSRQMDCEGEGISVGISPCADQIITDAVRQKIELETWYAPTPSQRNSTGACVPVRDIKRIFFADQKTSV